MNKKLLYKKCLGVYEQQLLIRLLGPSKYNDNDKDVRQELPDKFCLKKFEKEQMGSHTHTQFPVSSVTRAAVVLSADRE